MTQTELDLATEIAEYLIYEDKPDYPSPVVIEAIKRTDPAVTYQANKYVCRQLIEARARIVELEEALADCHMNMPWGW